MQYLYLTTTGWKSGNRHEIEIWFVEHDGRYYLMSERRERSHWVQNIQRSPAVTLRLGTRDAPLLHGTGRVVVADAEPELAAAVAAKMLAKYNWDGGLIVELSPAPRTESDG